MAIHDAVPTITSARTATSVKWRLCLHGAMLFVLLGISYLVITYHEPPDAVAIDAPANEFSSGRAMQHIRVIAMAPRPVGSAAHDTVRDYIINTLSHLKLAPEVQSADIKPRGSDTPVKVQNIVVRRDGTDGTGEAVMLLAHYDSVPQSYGASDDGAGVAVLLETLRALTSDQPLKRDVIALFTDGEELGQLGAAAYLQQSRQGNSPDLILNFEARGTRGPVFMFETSDHNGLLIREFSYAAPYPFCSSLAQMIYETLPNDTDLTVFKRARHPGLNFAFVDAAYNYHTRDDSIETIDERSVQHHGSYALALAKHFGDLPAENLRAENVIYFDLLGKTVVYYSKTLAQGLTIFNVILFVGVAV
jgi:hypothetical protein